jgi:hypothetical protein
VNCQIHLTLIALINNSPRSLLTNSCLIFIARLADDNMALASLEQYVLLNSSDSHNWTTDSLTVTRLVNLYSLLRGLGNMNYQIHYSREAEEIIFQLINNGEWDLLSARIHTVSLKWLFQQENIINSFYSFNYHYSFKSTPHPFISFIFLMVLPSAINLCQFSEQFSSIHFPIYLFQ